MVIGMTPKPNRETSTNRAKTTLIGPDYNPVASFLFLFFPSSLVSLFWPVEIACAATGQTSDQANRSSGETGQPGNSGQPGRSCSRKCLCLMLEQAWGKQLGTNRAILTNRAHG